MLSPLSHGQEHKGKRVFPEKKTFAALLRNSSSNDFVSLLYQDEQSCPWPLVFYITVDMFFCLFVIKNRLCTETGKGKKEDIRESKQTFVACGDNQLVDD